MKKIGALGNPAPLSFDTSEEKVLEKMLDTAEDYIQELPFGEVDGRTVFVLSRRPVSPASVLLFKEGILVHQGTDPEQYSVQGRGLIFTSSPGASGVLYACYPRKWAPLPGTPITWDHAVNYTFDGDEAHKSTDESVGEGFDGILYSDQTSGGDIQADFYLGQVNDFPVAGLTDAVNSALLPTGEAFKTIRFGIHNSQGGLYAFDQQNFADLGIPFHGQKLSVARQGDAVVALVDDVVVHTFTESAAGMTLRPVFASKHLGYALEAARITL